MFLVFRVLLGYIGIMENKHENNLFGLRMISLLRLSASLADEDATVVLCQQAKGKRSP